MWCPSVSLSLWANAWLAARPRPTTSWTRYLFGHQSNRSPRMMPSPPATPDCLGPTSTTPGTVSLLQTLRAAAGRDSSAGPRRVVARTINVVLPVPGDVRGLAAGTQFERDALAASEAVIITNPDDPGHCGRPGPRVRLRRSRGGTSTPSIAGLSRRAHVMDGVLTARRTGVRPPRAGRCRIHAAVSGAFGGRRTGRHRPGIRRDRHRRSARTRRAITGIHRATPDSRPCAVTRIAGAGERRARRRDHRGQRRAEPIARLRSVPHGRGPWPG